jgi:hypothetical protein
MIIFFEINYFWLTIILFYFIFFAGELVPFLVQGWAAQAKIEDSCTSVNKSKLMGNIKSGSFEILNFDCY